MRLKVELHRTVDRFLRHEAAPTEVEAFYRELTRVRADPVAMIERSEPMPDPFGGRYILRFFRFEGCIAIFETNGARDRICVRLCERLPPKREDTPSRGEPP